mgnify:FL=1
MHNNKNWTVSLKQNDRYIYYKIIDNYAFPCNFDLPSYREEIEVIKYFFHKPFQW